MKNDLEALKRLLDKRHSCRGFVNKQVPQTTIEEIVGIAQKVPSWCNAQPWQLAICSPNKTKELSAKLMKAVEVGMHEPEITFPELYQGVYKERRSTCGWQLYDAVGVSRGDREGSFKQMMENYRFFGAPQVAIVSSPKELGTYGAIDCGAFVTAFTLAAEGAGVATIPQAAVAAIAPVVRQVIDLPKDRNIVCAISFGYEDVMHPANQFRTGRVTPDEVIDWH